MGWAVGQPRLPALRRLVSTRRYAAGLAAAAALSIAPLAACGAGDQGRAAATSPSLQPSPTTTPSNFTTTSATPSTTRTTATRSTVPRPTATAAKSTATATTAPAPVPAPKPPPATLPGSGRRHGRAGRPRRLRRSRRDRPGVPTRSGRVPHRAGAVRRPRRPQRRQRGQAGGRPEDPGRGVPLRGGFGAYANPGLRVGSWLQVDAQDVWVDDSASSHYNTHQRAPANGRWASAEKLLNQPAYNYAQVIGYNEAHARHRLGDLPARRQGGRHRGCVSCRPSLCWRSCAGSAQEPSSPSADRWDRSGREPGEPAE